MLFQPRDITDLLRAVANYEEPRYDPGLGDLLHRAANEIERLRTALNNALRSQPHHSCSTGFFPCWCEEARRG